MKVRLYRGPFNGKILEVRDDQREIIFNKAENNFLRLGTDPSAPISIKQYIYRICPPYQRNGQIGWAVHPDGSVYFEWDKPRGSRA